MVDGNLLKKSLKFDSITIRSFTRKDCYISKNHFVKSCHHFQRNKLPASGCTRTDIFDLKHIPSKTQLTQWPSELATIRRITNDEYYMECDVGNLMYEDINNLMLLHSSSSIKSFVEQELNWFNSPKLQHYCIKSENTPNQDSISHFKRLLWDFQNNLDVDGMNMSPGHLAKLCCNRWLSSDHILKFAGMLSSPNCQAVYINYVRNLQNLID